MPERKRRESLWCTSSAARRTHRRFVSLVRYKGGGERGGDLAFPFVCSLPALSLLQVAGELHVQSNQSCVLLCDSNLSFVV